MLTNSLTLLLALLSISLAIDPSKISVALNCGAKSEVVSSSDGLFKYQPDVSMVAGASVDVDYHSDAAVSSMDFKYSHEKDLYMYERHTYSEMVYSLPVRQGVNTLIMKFAEMYFGEAGKRVFDIKIGDITVVKDLDIYEKAGSKMAAHEEYVEFQVKKDGVYIDGVRAPKGIENKKLRVIFSKGKADNPIIQGIVVYNKPIACIDANYSESPKAAYLKLKSEWSSQSEMRKARKQQERLKELIKIQKKNEKFVIRNDQLVFEEKDSQQDTSPPQRFGMIRSLLMSSPGILFWAASYCYVLYVLFYKLFKLDPPKERKEKSE